jgi:hypothetical protein
MPDERTAAIFNGAPAFNLQGGRPSSPGELPMRGLLLLSFLIAAALAIDAYAFGFRYSRAALREADYQTQQFSYKVNRHVTSPID